MATGSPAGSGAAAVPEDARTLWIDRDPQGERHKDWRLVVYESTEERHADSPLEGPVSTLALAKHMLRCGGDPRLWLATFLREKGIGASDRVAHELKVLTDTLQVAGCFDQVNVGALVCLEVVCRRIQTITDAYSGSGKPNWARARFFGGTSGIDDSVMPGLRNYVTRRARESRESGGGGNNDGFIDDAVADGGLPGGADPKGKGLGKAGGKKA